MAKIVIEGTVTPSTLLSTGDRKTVERNAFIEKLIAKGYVRVVEGVVETKPIVEEQEEEELAVPARNAKREVWAEFLKRLDTDIHFTADDGRDDLIALYESRG